MSAVHIMEDIKQGSEEWLDLRKTKITATDASVIMGVNPWKTKYQLYNEKISQMNNTFVNERMQRGVDLEPIARDLFNIQTGLNMQPAVVIKDWAMASLDGLSECGKYLVEIKCPSEKDHSIAASNKVPDHYYPQIQHQMYVSDVQLAYYYSFDGADGIIVEVERDEEYIAKMIDEEKKFYDLLINRTPPPEDYIERKDDLWTKCANNWKLTVCQIKHLEQLEDELRKQLIFLSGESNAKGAGISLCQIERKGNIDYSKIPELRNVDLEKYRKPSSNSWRITSLS